jgi:hypothetical protein
MPHLLKTKTIINATQITKHVVKFVITADFQWYL